MGLHTMCYLDIKAEEQRYLTVNEALQTLLELEKQKKEQVATSRTLVIGVARAGSHSTSGEGRLHRRSDKL